MVLEEVRRLTVAVKWDGLEQTLIGFAKAVNTYLSFPLPEQATMDDFFRAFMEGQRELVQRYFYVQCRVKPPPGIGMYGGRIGISYDFAEADALQGTISVSVQDNGECVPQQLFDQVYAKLRQHAIDGGLQITEETRKS